MPIMTIPSFYLQLATIFYELEKNDLAIDYYIRAISIYSKSEPKSNIALSDETRICRFDPPFKPSFLKRNEIQIPVNWTN